MRSGALYSGNASPVLTTSAPAPRPFSNLTTFPGQEVKLDAALIGRMVDGSTEHALVKSIIELAHALRLVVTAVGVEARRDWDLLEELGCDRIQGFYCGETDVSAPAHRVSQGAAPVPAPIEVFRNKT